MKVSTQQFYDKSLNNLQKAQSEAAKSNEQLSTGKALVRPSDDTLKLRSVANIDRAISAVENHNSNVDSLLNRFSLEESIVLSATDVTARLKELAIQASNATYSYADRKIMATEATSLRNWQRDHSQEKRLMSSGPSCNHWWPTVSRWRHRGRIRS